MKLKSFFIFLAAVLLYLPSVKYGFVLDDFQHIVRNENLKHFEFLLGAFQYPTWPGNLYRPLVVSSYVATVLAVGLEPWLFHLTNVLLHGLVSVVVALFVTRMFDSRRGLFAGLLFAVLPIHLEAVVGISNRTEILAALFGISSLLLLLRLNKSSTEHFTGHFIGQKFYSTLAAISFFLALCSKESAVVFLPLLLCCCLFEHGGKNGLRLCAQKCVWLLLPVVLYLALRANAFGGTLSLPYQFSPLDNPLVKAEPVERVANSLKLLGDYLKLSFVPCSLSADYSYAKLNVISGWAHGGWFSNKIALAFSFLLLFILAAFVGWKRNRIITFWVAWFFISFAITANIFFPIGTIFAERLCYLPSLAVVGLIVELLLLVPKRLVQNLFLGVIFVCYSIVVLKESSYWRDSKTLYKKEIDNSSESLKMQHNYGAALLESGDATTAEGYFYQALAIHDRYYPSAYALSGVARSRGDEKEQVKWLLAAIEMNPRFVPALEDLGWLNIKNQSLESAARMFDHALKVDRSSFYSLLGKMAIYSRTGKLTEAQALAKMLLKRRPKDPTLMREVLRLKQEVAPPK